MKIAIITPMFPPKWIGGTEIATQAIARYLARNGNEVHVITSLDKGLMKESREDNFFAHRIDWPRIKFLGLVSFWIKCLFLLKKIRPDIAHSQSIQMGPPCFFAKLFWGIPYVVYGRGFDIYFPWKFKKTVSAIVLNNADAVIALSEDMKKRIQENYRKVKVFVVPNAINLEEFNIFSQRATRREIKIDEADDIVLFVGSLKVVKGIEYLIEAFKIISREIPAVSVLLVGNGSERQKLEYIVKKAGLGHKVNFIGQVDNNKIPGYMAISDIFVLPSLSEGFSVALLEAMASGLPIVATKVGGIPEVVEDTVNGFLVDPKNPEQIAEKVLLLLKNEKLRQNISENNKRKAQKYSLKNKASKLLKIYSICLKK